MGGGAKGTAWGSTDVYSTHSSVTNQLFGPFKAASLGASSSSSIIKDFAKRILTFCLRNKTPSDPNESHGFLPQKIVHIAYRRNFTYSFRKFRNLQGLTDPRLRRTPALHDVRAFSVCKISFFQDLGSWKELGKSARPFFLSNER